MPSVCASGAPADPLPVARDGDGDVTCLPGFRCSHLDPANTTTYPVACVPTPACAVERLFGRPCDPPQSLFEPELCAAGSYCPSAAVERPCPAGSFCPKGCVAPVACPPLSICPEGSSKPRAYGPLLATVLLLAAVAAVRYAYLSRWRLRGQQQQPPPPSATTSVNGRSDSSSSSSNGRGDEVPVFLFPPAAAGTVPALTAPLLRAPLLVDPLAFSRSASREDEEMADLGPLQRRNSNVVAATDRVANTELAQHFRAVSDGREPIRVDFRDLRVTLPASSGSSSDGDQGRVLLEGVSGTLRPGTVTAIMGPSGAGKTVLLTTLLQRIDPSWRVEGRLEVNKGRGNFADLRSSIGFVPQDDTLHNELTVEANLYYASEVRLPSSWPAERRQAMREVVLEALGLLPHRTTPIGTETERGVSGGQRKRVSIGVELASAPRMLILDEPTSGLDATTSLELVTTLKEVAVAANLTIAMVIHQPRVEIWDALDELLILGVGGRTVFKGPQPNCQRYFASKGVEFNPKHNPADVIIDTIAGATTTTTTTRDFPQLWIDDCDEAELLGPAAPNTPLLPAVVGAGAAPAAFQGASPARQFVLYAMRSAEKQLSDIKPFVVEMIVITLCGLILGNSMADFQMPGNYKEPYDAFSPYAFKLLLPQLHMYQLMSLGLAAAVAGVNVFGVERPHYFREVPTGMHRAAYFLGNVAASLPRVCLTALVYSSLFTFLASLPVPFAYLYFSVLLCYWSIYGLGECVSVTASREASPLIASTASIGFAAFNGFIAKLPDALKRLTPGFYASQILQEQHARWIDHWAADPLVSGETGYEWGRATESFAIMVGLALALHAAAFALMVLTHRSRQR